MCVVGADPLVSILLPVRDGAETLSDALRSLEHQTLTDWECLIVDDGSHDDTPRLCRHWSRQDSRFRHVRFDERRGIVAALNAAAAQARAALLARQDADDRSLPLRLARQVEYLRCDPGCVAVATRVRLFPQDALPTGLRAYGEWLDATLTPEQIARDIWVESPLPHPTVVMRRDAFETCGGYCQGPWPEDYDLWLRMHVRGWRLGKVAECLYEWRHHPGRLTFTDPRYSPAAFLECKLRQLAPRLAGRTVRIWGAGRDGRRLRHALRARDIEPTAFIDIDPRKIGRRRLGLRVESPEEALEISPAGTGACRAGAHPSQGGAGAIILVAVGTRGARGLIRARLSAAGLREPDDFLCLH